MIVKENPNGTDSNKMYSAANYSSAGVYQGIPQDWAILVSKKENTCLAIKKLMLEDAIEGIAPSINTPLNGFSIDDVLKLIAIRPQSSLIQNLIK